MSLTKRSISLSGHRTSIALEPAFWAVLDRMAGSRSLAALVAEIDASRTERGDKLASALRVAALTFLQAVGAQGGDGPSGGPVNKTEPPCPPSPLPAPPLPAPTPAR